MDPKEIDAIIVRIEGLKAKQAEIEAMQRQMTEQASTVKKAIDAEAEMLRRIRLGPANKDSADAGV